MKVTRVTQATTMKEIEVGGRYTNNKGLEFIVIGKEKVCKNKEKRIFYKVRFITTGFETFVRKKYIQNGSVTDPYDRHIYCVACKGAIVCDTKLKKALFKRWYGMIERCYNIDSYGYNSYGAKGVYVCDRWLCFENYYNDIQKLDGYSEEDILNHKIELDKDILEKDNKEYSPLKCMFVNVEVNRQVMPSKQKTIYATDGKETLEFENISLFSKTHSLREGSVRKALQTGESYKGWYFRYANEVKVRKIVGWSEVLDAARWTINKLSLHKEPSDLFKRTLLISEHSPIRNLRFVIEMNNVPSWVSQHLSRHDAFAGHCVRDGSGDVHFVGTQRGDRTGIDRHKLPQDAPVSHRIDLNAMDLINISRKRLCNCASKETKKLWIDVKEKIRDIEPYVADVMVPECVYRGFCPEKESCGFVRTESFMKQRYEYTKYLPEESVNPAEKEYFNAIMKDTSNE